MRKVNIGAVIVAAAAMTVGGSVAAVAATGWQTESTPNISGGYSLDEAAAFGANDVWAVGPAYGSDHTVLEHWDGTNWLRNAGPAADDFNGQSISGTSGSDVWASGNCTFSDSPTETPCVTHWDGSTWGTPTKLPVPDIGTTVTVDAVSADDVWAAGGETGSAYYVHFDGSKWTKVAAPSSGSRRHFITDLAATGPNDVWAAGYSSDPNGDDTGDRPLIQHWNGTSWTTMGTPNTTGRLAQIATMGGSRVWAVGDGTSDPTVLRRSGTSFYAAPAVPGTDTFATGVAPDNSGGAWVALTGAFPEHDGGAPSKTAHYAHFSGGTWTLANGGTYAGTVRSWTLTQVPGTGSLYAVGSYSTSEDDPGTGYVESYGG